MNWYKKAQLDKDAGWGKFLGLTIPAIALSLGLAAMDVEKRIKDNPQQLAQQIQQKQVEDQNAPSGQQELKPTVPQQSFNLEEVGKTIERHEGKRNKVYLDSKNIPTIGIGFNLDRIDAQDKIERVGANYRDIRDGRESLTDQQVYSLFNDSLNEAVVTAHRFLPNFNEHPSQVQSILINMAFNLGPNCFT